MSLKDKLKKQETAPSKTNLVGRFGVSRNPFPASSQTSDNPRFRLEQDNEADARILSFMRDQKSQVVVIEGTQGVGKTNFLNFFETEIEEALSERDGYYVVRYLADPEASFDGTIRRLFLELGVDHLCNLVAKIDDDDLLLVKGHDLRVALRKLAEANDPDYGVALLMEWLLGFRVLKSHRETLGVHFRLDTVESKTLALRDLVILSSKVGILNGIFLLLDELEKQDGVLGPTAVVRYLSAMRAIIDALPNHLFMMIAVTPDAMRRYSSALPAFRSRLQNQITLEALDDESEALKLAKFYIEKAIDEAQGGGKQKKKVFEDLIEDDEVIAVFNDLKKLSDRRGDRGVRQREFLHHLHRIAEERLQD